MLATGDRKAPSDSHTEWVVATRHRPQGGARQENLRYRQSGRGLSRQLRVAASFNRGQVRRYPQCFLVPPGSRAAVRELSPQVRGGRCRSSTARAKYRLQNGFHHRKRCEWDRPGAANRAFEILRSMMFRAEECGFRERGTNPCIGIRKNPRRNVARFLDTDELARLGRALNAREGKWPEAVAAIRLLALTGCRRGEVLDLRWRDIGDGVITLADIKTGPRTVQLGEAAQAIVAALPGSRDPDAFLFPKNAGRDSPTNIVACWRAVCDDANLGKLRLHDLRHTAASHAVMSGENLPFVGKLLGHHRHSTTAGYAHLADGHLVETAEKIGSIIAKAMDIRTAPPPSRPRARRGHGRWI